MTLDHYEKKYNMPKGILRAIAFHESGFRVKRNKKIRTIICPYAVNIAGKGRYFSSRSKAEKFIKDYLKNSKNKVIDIGVMQINLHYHGDKFSSVSEMFDIKRNIAYGAQLLYKLKQKHHSWTLAVGKYHNANHKINTPYKNVVFRKWRDVRRSMFAKSFGLEYRSTYES